MCGISGIIGIGGDISEMVRVQHKRGPDNNHISTTMVDQEHKILFLGHNRLSIIDLSERGDQPMRSGRYTLTYNGEIYNFKDLPGHGNDAARLLESIEQHGLESTLKTINGMYAFALYDRLLDELHLVCDRFGQKPLYYYHDENVFAFASTPAALLHLKEKWHINSESVRTYFMLGSVMGHSIFDGIKKVQGAHHIRYVVGANAITENRYWYPEFKEDTSNIEELVVDAIEKVKVADVPVYLFLSGGIDSTVVASLSQGMDAIHLDGPEKGYAVDVANKFGINLHIVDPSDVEAYEAICDYSMSGEPSMSGIIPWITSKEVSKFCKVAITANGADELFFGYDRTQDEPTVKQFAHLFRMDYGPPPEIDLIDKRLSIGRWWELQTYVQCDLNKTLDFASMAHSLEVRAPFLDHRLVECALSIPQRDHGRKAILKNMLRRHGFGNKFLERPKMGFSLYKSPLGYDALKEEAFKWCIEQGFIKNIGYEKRDWMYLKAAAAGFYGWYQTWKHKL